MQYCERERERECVCMCVCVCVCVCVCALDREQSRVFASTALVVGWTAMYLTGYSDNLSSFCEPLSTPCRCHTGLKKV